MLKGAIPTHGGTALELCRPPENGKVSNAVASRQTIANTRAGKTGTGFAVITSIRVPRPSDAEPARRRGGARNRADRVSHRLTAAQVAGLVAAAHHAGVIGLPLNRMTTIHWERAGVPLSGMAKATGRYIDLVTRWMARRGERTAWLYVHENGPAKGGHCHLLLHVAPALVRALSRRQRKIIKHITGKPYRARAIASDPVGGKLGIDRAAPDLHAANLAKALAYLVKGADDDAAALLGLYRLDGGGVVIGKRCGTSQNIGAKARKAGK